MTFKKYWHATSRSWIVVVAVLAAGALTGWVGDLIMAWARGEQLSGVFSSVHPLLAALILSLIFMFVFAPAIYTYSKKMIKPEKVHEEQARGAKILLLPLSEDRLAIKFEYDASEKSAYIFSEIIGKIKLTNLDDDIHTWKTFEKANEKHKLDAWQMLAPLFAINAHTDTLDSIELIVSNESKSSSETIIGMMKYYFPNIAVGVANPVDMTDYDSVSLMLEKLIKKWKRSIGKGDADSIFLDVTSGVKTISIAGAMITLNNKAKFQYVNLNNNNSVTVTMYEMYAETA